MWQGEDGRYNFAYQTQLKRCQKSRVADPHHFNADQGPDPSFNFDADPEVRIRLFIKVMRICDFWTTDTLRFYFESTYVHYERQGPSMTKL